jgi:catechol 2,3-dioxygenase-like lactoylglutathione lyase family enzyme
MNAPFNHLGHSVGDLDRARRFYTELLGFTVRNEMTIPDGIASKLMRVPEPVGLSVLYLERDGFVLELLHFDRPMNAPARVRDVTEPGFTHLSFCVDDLAAACRQVTDLGGEVLADTAIGEAAVMVRDPDGQLLELLPPSYRGGS